jgi:hypothetical protein
MRNARYVRLISWALQSGSEQELLICPVKVTSNLTYQIPNQVNSFKVWTEKT